MTTLFLIIVTPSWAAHFHVVPGDPWANPDPYGYRYIALYINTEKDEEVIAADMLATFDPTVMKVRRIIGVEEVEQPASFWIDNMSIVGSDIAEGRIYIGAAINTPGDTFSGNGIIAALEVEIFKREDVHFTFVCEPGNLNDSNISSNSADARDIINCSRNTNAPLVLPPITPRPPCTYLPKDGFPGDYNCDTKVTLADFEVWRSRYIEGSASLKGFELWRRVFTRPGPSVNEN